MAMRRDSRLLIGLALVVAPVSLMAQTATGVVLPPSSASEPGPPFRHLGKLLVSYDSVADTTHLALVTHKGEYFLWIQHPRLTWTIAYAGRTPGTQIPAEVVLVFRTQGPQVPRDNRLILELASGERSEVASVSAYSYPGPMMSSLFLRFPIPTAQLAKALAGERMTVSVGGIQVDLNPNQMQSMRDLLTRAEAWPPTSVSGAT
jgi:hypothetical protein